MLIGPVKSGQEGQLGELQALPNVWYLGPRPWEQLPAYLWNMQVGVIPYRQSHFAEARCPLKLYEYVAAGMGVALVGAEVPESLRGFVGAAVSPASFAAKVQQAATRHVQSVLVGQSRDMRERLTWRARSEELSALIEGQVSRCAP